MIRVLLVLLVLGGAALLGGCGPLQAADTTVATPTATPVPPTATPVPPTATPVPPTATPVPPTATPVPPTATPVPPTATPVPPTATPVPPTATPVPPSAPDTSALPPSQPVRLVIDNIGLNRPLVSVGLDENRYPIVPNHDVGWYNLSANPGTGDNVVLWGHVLRFRSAPDIPAPFARLQELDVGAPVTLYDAEGRAHQYEVSQQVWALPSEVEYILPQGSEQVTMVSCIGDKVIVDGSLQMTHRLITIATPRE
jgi:hypothetical protein